MSDRKALEAKISANRANAARFCRIAVAQRDSYKKTHWFACAAVATKRAETYEAELKQMGEA